MYLISQIKLKLSSSYLIYANNIAIRNMNGPGPWGHPTDDELKMMTLYL